MRGQNEQQVKLIQSLIGGTIKTSAVDSDNEFFGMVVEKGGKETILWVLRDPEGNGPGFLEEQPGFLEGEKT